MPWDKDFTNECDLVYKNEIEPQLLEIDALIKQNSFIKNLFGNMFDNNVYDTCYYLGNLIITIFSVASKSQGDPMLDAQFYTEAADKVIDKTKQSYTEFKDNKKIIQDKDMFFYYKANQLMDKRKKIT